MYILAHTEVNNLSEFVDYLANVGVISYADRIYQDLQSTITKAEQQEKTGLQAIAKSSLKEKRAMLNALVEELDLADRSEENKTYVYREIDHLEGLLKKSRNPEIKKSLDQLRANVDELLAV